MPVHFLVLQTECAPEGRAIGPARIQASSLDMHARNVAVSHRAHVLVVLIWFLPVKGRPISRSPDSAFRPARCLRMRVAYVVLLVNDTEAFPDLGVS